MANDSTRTVMVQGRLVWLCGKTPFLGKPQFDQNTRQPNLDKNGQQKVQYGFGLAVPKTSLAQTGPGQPGEIWAAIHQEAQSMYQGANIPPGFAMKYKDGDNDIDDKGHKFSDRKGYAGHLVFAMTTNLPVKFYKWENGQNIQINEGVKCGDYVNVHLVIKAHPAVGTAKAGLYLNPMAVQFLGFGEEIVNTPSGDQIFGNAAPPMPAGASAVPLMPQGMVAPNAQGGIAAPPVMPAISTPSFQQAQNGVNTAYPSSAPAAAPAPYHQVLPPQFQPPPTMPAMPPMGAPGAGFPMVPGVR